MAGCLPRCARLFSVPGTELVGIGGSGAFLLLPGALCNVGVLALPVFSLVCTGLGSQRCASCWTRPVGGGQWEHYLCYSWGICWAAQKTACQIGEGIWKIHGFDLCMLASVGRPSLQSCDACMVYWAQGASLRNCRKNKVRPFFLLLRFFCLVGLLGYGFGV